MSFLMPTLGRLLANVTSIRAAQAVTGTIAAPSPTRAVVLSPTAGATPVPAGAIDLARIASGDYLGQVGQVGVGPFSALFALMSAALLAAGLYFFFIGKNRWHRVHKLNYQVANFWSVAGMSLGLLGVLFVIFRLAGVDGLDNRFWFYLIFLIWLGFAAYAVYYFRLVYPGKLAAYSKTLKPRSPGATRARAQAARPAADGTPPARPVGSPGNPRGSSARGERRREKKR
ncbi:MAG TPA: hypothetical protein VKY74_15815 [Chloroflexia bacterium]|nr:hypothetical protein [Chloroflexia bacterium]